MRLDQGAIHREAIHGETAITHGAKHQILRRMLLTT